MKNKNPRNKYLTSRQISERCPTPYKFPLQGQVGDGLSLTIFFELKETLKIIQSSLQDCLALPSVGMFFLSPTLILRLAIFFAKLIILTWKPFLSFTVLDSVALLRFLQFIPLSKLSFYIKLSALLVCVPLNTVSFLMAGTIYLFLCSQSLEHSRYSIKIY